MSFLKFFFSTFFFPLLPLLSSAQQQPTSSLAAQPNPPSITCKSTFYPPLCHVMHSAFKSNPSDPYNTGNKFNVERCLNKTLELYQSIDRYLHIASQDKSEYYGMLICIDMSTASRLNLQDITILLEKEAEMSDGLVDHARYLLSSVVEYQQRCYNSLTRDKSPYASALSKPTGNMTQLNGISLELVTRAVTRNLKRHMNRTIVGKPNGPVRVRLEDLIKRLHGEHTTLSKSNSNGILINKTVVVSPDNTTTFRKISDAIAAAPSNSNPEDGYFVIYAKKGLYEEYVVVPKDKKNILLIGDGINKTIITGNRNTADNWPIHNSATFTVSGERFVAVDVTFRNAAGPEKHQAVAVTNTADSSAFYRCSFEGYQSTLYAQSSRQFYRDSEIYGTVDVIFGNAAAVFQNCRLFTREPLPGQKNTFTAHGRSSPTDNTGFVIHKCKIDAAPEWAGELSTNSSYLGRPWKPYSRTVIMLTNIGKVINPAGWLEYNGTVGLDTLYYGELMNRGPGADTSMRVEWPKWKGYHSSMWLQEAMNFTVSEFIGGDAWLSEIDVPFVRGLF